MKMIISTTRKRKPSSLDPDSGPPAKKGVREPASPCRRSPRKLWSPAKKSPQASPSKPAGRSARSPQKPPSVVPSSFYGKQKTVYLTPLERKAVKECLPALPSPPPVAKKPQTKIKENVNGGNKSQRSTVRSAKGGKRGTRIPLATTKLIRQPKINSSKVAAKPEQNSSNVSASNKPEEAKGAFTITFSCLKPKPKLFVGAAFFGTGKKPTSVYKTSAPKSSARPAAPPQKKNKRPKWQQEAQETDKPEQKLKQRSEVVPSVDEEPDTSQPSSALKISGVDETTQNLKIVLSRIPESVISFNSQDDSVAECGSGLTFDLSEANPTCAVSHYPDASEAVYPIFASASKRSKKKARRAPLSCITSSDSSGESLQKISAAAAKEGSVRRRKEKQDSDQLIIDAGQKQFGATTCSSCGMIYSADNPDDHFQHTQFHQRFLDSIKYVGWKKERVVDEFWDGKILLVLPDDPKYAVRKAEDVRRVADSELGFQQVTLSRPMQAKTYMFINTQRLVVGCLVAEPIRQAYRVLEQPAPNKDMTKDDFMERHRAWCCSTVPEPAVCGISRVWVFSQSRRQSIATRMLDTARRTFIYGSYLTKEEIAFSDPTPDGKLFATKYCNTPTFLVYNFVS
ncbi:N-acetyltransferase ESCO2 isoform X2 [Nothobranchius furzeri]|uniref:Transcript variant X2 n=1 Tax=Nothobranchius furzeri TaxID=105023 RepID=A0A9D2Z234_NOTFU|nr:transcript variant X2 [Nothobranchius furzeri]